MEDDDEHEAGTDRPKRDSRGKRRLPGQCRWKQGMARRSAQQQSLELFATEGEREHEELSMDGIESSVSEAEAESDDEETTGAAAGIQAGEKRVREEGTRGKQHGQRRRKVQRANREQVDVSRADPEVVEQS